MELNETLKKYGFSQEMLDRLQKSNGSYWGSACHFVGNISLYPLPLSEKQEAWLKRIQGELGKGAERF